MSFARRLTIVLLLFLLFQVHCAFNNTGVEVQKYTQYDNLFNRKNGWTGADGAYSVFLSETKTLWLYGDTWVGTVRNNRHVDSILVNNSIAIQTGKDPSTASVRFFFGRTSDGKPDAFVKPANGQGWFWVFDGIKTSKGLYLFLVQIDRTGNVDTSGFKIIGTWLGCISNPDQSPEKWRITQKMIPWGKYTDKGDTFFGSSILRHKDLVYIYGTTEDIIGGVHHKFMTLAKAPAKTLDDFKSWRFFSNGRWVDDFSLASRICPDMANEYSVSYLPVIDKYACVYTQNSVSENIMIRHSPKPYGPWSAPVSIFTCPEATWDDGNYCYAAKAHFVLTSSPNELVITYVANSNDFWKMAADARLYRPRFLRVIFSRPSLRK